MFWKAVLVVLVLATSGCSDCGKNYNSLRARCKQMCKQKQSDNVGSTFMFRDVHGTFGKCKCFDREGKKIDFYISVED